jgi:hypothetical protein
MSRLVQQFEVALPQMTDEDRANALRIIEAQIKMTWGHVRDMVEVTDGANAAYREAWTVLIQKCRRDLEELESVRKLLSPK